MDFHQRFEALEQRFFRDWVMRHPILGSSLGLHEDYDEEMPGGAYEEELEDHRLLAHWIDEFRQRDPEKLSPSLAVDRELALAALGHWLAERSQVRLWERRPETAQTVGSALHQILFRNYAPLKERMRRLLKRLEVLPRYVDESRSRLRRPVKYYVEIELETLTRLPGFFNTIREISREHMSAAMERVTHKLIETAQNALEKYCDWLIVDILPESDECWPIGEEALRALLKARGIDETPASLVAQGQAEMARQLERLRELGRQIKRKARVEDVRDLLRAQHPDSNDAVLRFVRESLIKARQFVNRSKFASLPEHDSVYVIETPTFLRHVLPFGGYHPPARFEAKRDGYVWVTPGDCDSDKLKEHNYAALTILTTHLSYPGRHLMGAWSLQHPSPLRALTAAPETIEGWAYYADERVKELGYEDTPTSRFWLVQAALNGAARMVLDVQLNTGRMSFVEGVEFLIDHLGMDRVAAEAEARRITVNPTAAATEFWARERVKELKKQVKEWMKGRFSDLFFHNAVLKSGPLPLKVLRKELEWRVQEELARPVEPAPAAARNSRPLSRTDSRKAAPSKAVSSSAERRALRVAVMQAHRSSLSRSRKSR